MTIDLKLNWVKCAICGVTQPLSALKYTTGRRPLAELEKSFTAPKHWACTNEAKCAEWKADLQRQREEFRRADPVLHAKPEIVSSFAKGKARR